MQSVDDDSIANSSEDEVRRLQGHFYSSSGLKSGSSSNRRAAKRSKNLIQTMTHYGTATMIRSLMRLLLFPRDVKATILNF